MNDTDDITLGDAFDDVSNDPIPCYMSNGAPEGHSAIDALEAARTLGEWLSRHPTQRIWAMTFALGQINGLQKVIVRDTADDIVLYTEASGTDVARIFNVLGVSHDATEHVNVLVRDGLDIVQAGAAAALLKL